MERPLRERLEALTAFLPEFRGRGFSFGEWGGGERTAPHAFTRPSVAFSETASRFIQAAYDFGWVRGDFSWTKWMQTPEAINLRDDPGAILQATSDQLAKLLTVIIRQDRFVEGELLSTFASGMLMRIVERAAALLDGMDRADTP